MPHNNAVVRVHKMEPRYKLGALYVIFRQGRHPPKTATKATEANVLIVQSMHDL